MYSIYTSVSDPGFFPDPDQTFFLSPDPWKKRPKTGVKVEKIYISCTLNTVLFGQAYQNHHLDPHKFINERIRTFKLDHDPISDTATDPEKLYGSGGSGSPGHNHIRGQN